MATLTEQMRDLAGGILNGHEERRAWLGALRDEVGSMRGENRASARGLREAANDLRERVKEMLNEGAAARRDAAAADRKQRRAWLRSMRKDVKSMLNELEADQHGARRAWLEMVSLVESQRRGPRPAGAVPHAARPTVRSRSSSRRRR